MPPALIAMHVLPRLPQALGTLLGFNWLAMSIGATLGPPLAGTFVDGTGVGWHLLMACASFSLAVASCVLWLSPSTPPPQQQLKQRPHADDQQDARHENDAP